MYVFGQERGGECTTGHTVGSNLVRYTTNDYIIVSNAEGLVFALTRNVGISVLNANLSGKARRAAAMDAERARVQVEMGCLYQTRGLHPSQSPSVL